WEFCLYLLAGYAVAEGSALIAGAVRAYRSRRAAAPTGGPIPAADGPRLGAWAPEPAAEAGEGPGRWRTPALVPVLAVAVAAVFVGGPLGAFDRLGPDIGLSSLSSHLGGGPSHASFVPDWIRWNYSGYQQKASYSEYNSLIRTMSSVGSRYGCGRAMWEYESEQNRFGTPEALMLLPYWTN